MSDNYNWLAEDREEHRIHPTLELQSCISTRGTKVKSVSLTEELGPTYVEPEEDNIVTNEVSQKSMDGEDWQWNCWSRDNLIGIMESLVQSVVLTIG